MTDNQAIALILAELDAARKKHPFWPTDVVHQAAIVAEESGELVRATLRYHYAEDAEWGEAMREARHTAATCVRLMVGG
jgi:hypothetical protein